MVNGAVITAARAERQISQKTLGDLVGVNELTVWRWENKPTKTLDYFTARRLAEVLEIDADDLFHDPDSAEPASCSPPGRCGTGRG